MISFVETKIPDYEFVRRTLEVSQNSGRWANFGPVSRLLEERIEELLNLSEEHRAVACASGTAALFALVRLYSYLEGRSLRFVVSAFTFACQKQGPLAEALVVDCGEDGFLDIEAVESLQPDQFDGIIVTHLFGGAADVARWQVLARETGKRLLFDSAACFGSSYREKPLGSFGDGEAFSFHHTKPCGVGEGGCVVVPAQLENTLRSILNFGRYAGIDTGRYSSNGKMSDVSAAFILDRLRFLPKIRSGQREQWQRIAHLGANHGFEILGEPSPSLPSLVALLAPTPLDDQAFENPTVKLHRQYPPLAPSASVSWDLYRRHVCFPCHPQMAGLSEAEIDGVFELLIGTGGRAR